MNSLVQVSKFSARQKSLANGRPSLQFGILVFHAIVEEGLSPYLFPRGGRAGEEKPERMVDLIFFPYLRKPLGQCLGLSAHTIAIEQ